MKEAISFGDGLSRFKGYDISDIQIDRRFTTSSFQCPVEFDIVKVFFLDRGNESFRSIVPFVR